MVSSNWSDNIRQLQITIDNLRQHSLKVKQSKCSFAQTQVAYLGHVISGAGVQADPQKVQAIQQWPIPSNLKKLRGFLGLAGYYRRFIRDFGKLAKPLTDLLKKNSFVWTDQATAAFAALKLAMSSPPLLALPDFSQVFEVETDASGDGIGAVLSQKGRPLAFYSQALAPKHKGLSVYEREMIAIVSAVQKWRPYLLGRRFIIKTDHQSLKYMIEQRVSTPMQ